jgi:hypothetical protein
MKALDTPSRVDVLSAVPFDIATQGRDVESHGAHRQFFLCKQMRVVAAERLPSEPIDPAASVIALARAEGMNLRADRPR